MNDDERYDVLKTRIGLLATLDPHKRYDSKYYDINISADKTSKYIAHVQNCVDRALANESKCHPELLNIYWNPGFSGISFRHLINNLCSIDSLNYLEVGTYKGSTFSSALYGNLDNFNSIYTIDNWSEFNPGGSISKVFHNRINTWYSHKVHEMNIMDVDCFNFDKSAIKDKINFYFYDGPHKQEHHEMAYTYFNEVLDDVFITIVDDWEKNSVRQGTYDAFKKLNYNVLAKWEITPPERPDRMNNPDQYWWHGTMIAVIKK